MCCFSMANHIYFYSFQKLYMILQESTHCCLQHDHYTASNKSWGWRLANKSITFVTVFKFE